MSKYFSRASARRY